MHYIKICHLQWMSVCPNLLSCPREKGSYLSPFKCCWDCWWTSTKTFVYIHRQLWFNRDVLTSNTIYARHRRQCMTSATLYGCRRWGSCITVVDCRTTSPLARYEGMLRIPSTTDAWRWWLEVGCYYQRIHLLRCPFISLWLPNNRQTSHVHPYDCLVMNSDSCMAPL